MVYSVDITEEGKKCEIIIKGETLTCVVVYAYEWINKNKEVIRKYKLEAKNSGIGKTILLKIVREESKCKTYF